MIARTPPSESQLPFTQCSAGKCMKDALSGTAPDLRRHPALITGFLGRALEVNGE
jgi:hypothetical protein